MKSGIQVAFWICLPVLLAAVAIAVWNPSGNYWGSVEPPKAQCEAYDVYRLQSAKALTIDIYDPQKLDRVIREPQNTVSNVAYAFAGVAVLFASRRFVCRGLAFACIFLGFGSGLYHASLLPEWRMLDILGVYAVLFSLLAVGFGAAFDVRRGMFDLVATPGAWVFAVVTGIHRNDVRIAGVKLFDSTYVVVAAVGMASLGALVAWRHARKSPRYRISLIVLSVVAPLAFFGGVTDRFGGLLANPDALFQGHTIWHTMGAVALLAAYEIYASTGFDRSIFDRQSPEPNQSSEPRIAPATVVTSV